MAIFPLISLSIPGSFLNGFKLTMDAANLQTSLTNCSIKSISVYLENSLTIHNLKKSGKLIHNPQSEKQKA